MGMGVEGDPARASLAGVGEATDGGGIVDEMAVRATVAGSAPPAVGGVDEATCAVGGGASGIVVAIGSDC